MNYAGYVGWRRLAAIATAYAGRVNYAGSDESGGFNVTAPGGAEAWVSLGGPLLQLAYGGLLVRLALLIFDHAHGFFVSVAAVVVVAVGLANVAVAALSFCPRMEGDRRSDGWHIREAICRWLRGGRGGGDAAS